MVIVRIPFNQLYYNEIEGKAELIFQHNGRWYRLTEDKIPSRYWRFRKVYLWLTENKTFDRRVCLDLDEKPMIEINLDEAELISEDYPL